MLLCCVWPPVTFLAAGHCGPQLSADHSCASVASDTLLTVDTELQTSHTCRIVMTTVPPHATAS